MKKIIYILLLYPLLSTAQKTQSRFENDTLYTSTGYKIYKGQILHLANGTSEAGYFRYVKFHSSMVRTDTYILQNGTILVNKVKSQKNSELDNNIRIFGTASLTDGRQLAVDIILNFENAITNTSGQTPELTVPEAFKNQLPESKPVEIKIQDTPGDIKKLLVADEIKKLFDLYKQGALTKDEYESQKKKLLERQ